MIRCAGHVDQNGWRGVHRVHVLLTWPKLLKYIIQYACVLYFNGQGVRAVNNVVEAHTYVVVY